MRWILVFAFLMFTAIAYPQFPQFSGGDFNADFSKGSVVLNDGTERKGYLKTLGNQKANLLFRESNEYGVRDTTVYQISDIASFRMFPNYYQRMHNVQLYAHEWGMSGKLTTAKEIFAQVVNTGAVNIYAFQYMGLDRITAMYLHTSLIFERKTARGTERAPFPVKPRCTDAQYEKAKLPALAFFANYPEIVKAIKAQKKTAYVYELVQLVREIE